MLRKALKIVKGAIDFDRLVREMASEIDKFLKNAT